MQNRTTLPMLALALALPLALAACGGEPAERVEGVTQATPPTEATPEAPAPSAVRMEDGVQVVAIEAGMGGYQPREVTLEAGVPARLVFTRTVDSECSSQVQIPAFHVPLTDLPMHEPVAIEFTPDEAGTFEFVCGMDMMSGTLVVRS